MWVSARWVCLLVLLGPTGSRARIPEASSGAGESLQKSMDRISDSLTSWFSTSPDETPDVTAQAAPTTSEAVYSFSQTFLNEYRSIYPDTNLIYSPVSLLAAFSLVYFGAEGMTKSLMESTLGFQNGVVPAALAAKDDESLDMSKVVSVANRAFFADSIKVKDGFATAVGKKNIQNLPFASDPQESMDTINNFVDAATKGLIPEIVTQKQITELTQMVLVNAIYFKGAWEFKFPEEQTSPLEFRGVSGPQNVDFMTFGKPVALAVGNVPELDSQVIELPYSNPRFRMYVLLPNTDEGWKSVEQNLAGMDPTFFVQNIVHQDKVYVSLPKWTVDSSVDEVSLFLTRMGLGSLFKKPNLSGMADTVFQLTDVVHKAKIIVDEEGTEAAAATVVISSRSFPLFDDSIHFVADHPFLYFILDRNDDTILFQGTITDL